jgi:hypothetical protein
VKHFTDPAFWDAFNQLTPDLQKRARRNFELLKSDPKHPSLHFKQIKKYWSVRVNKDFRALAVEAQDGFVWFWIGNHQEYDLIINNKKRPQNR